MLFFHYKFTKKLPIEFFIRHKKVVKYFSKTQNNFIEHAKELLLREECSLYLYLFVKYIMSHLRKHFYDIIIKKNEIIIRTSVVGLPIIMFYLKNHCNCQYKLFVDLVAVDFPNRRHRFLLIYNLLSINFNSRVRIEVPVSEFRNIPSMSTLYKAATWFEREVWDLFGIYFYNNIDLRRILTDYGFRGYPLRKDFPLTGFVEVRYDKTRRRVLYHSIKLSQEYRRFDFLKPWYSII